MWFVSIIAMLAWSGSDIFSKIGTPTEDKDSHYKVGIAVGSVMGIHALYMVLSGTPFSFSDIITYLPASFFYITSMLIGYIGLRYIELSISSPAELEQANAFLDRYGLRPRLLETVPLRAIK